MKRKRINAARVWKEMEDELLPRLRLTVIERAVYSYLLRHTHLEGTARISFSVAWLARGTRLCVGTARRALKRLLSHGALRLVSLSKSGHMIEVRLPGQIRARSTDGNRAQRAALAIAGNIEEADFMSNAQVRELIHAREGGFCFYCLRRMHCAMRCLDHVVPQSKFGSNSYRNLVSACIECNSQKRSARASDFLRQLYRERRLTATELAARLRALDALAAGKLPPPLPRPDMPLQRRGRPRRQPEPQRERVVRGSRWAGKR
jgi:5-methylcytosine-specific restriction endonuclease McrA